MVEGIQSAERERLYPERVYVSVHNIVRQVRIAGTTETYYVAVRNKNPITVKGKTYPRFQALGGAVKTTEKLRQKLKADVGALFGNPKRPNEEHDDARFFMPIPEELRGLDEATTKKRSAFIGKIMETFTDRTSGDFETSVLRELKEDLVPAVMSEEDFNTVATEYVGAVSPIQYADKTSERAENDTPSMRLFHLHDIVVSKAVFDKLASSADIRILSKSDIQKRVEANIRGEAAAVTDDGVVIVENIFPDRV